MGGSSSRAADAAEAWPTCLLPLDRCDRSIGPRYSAAQGSQPDRHARVIEGQHGAPMLCTRTQMPCCVRDAIQPPGIGNALQFMLAGVFETRPEPAVRSRAVWVART